MWEPFLLPLFYYFLACVKSYPSIMDVCEAWNSNKALLASACILRLAHPVVSCVASQEVLTRHIWVRPSRMAFRDLAATRCVVYSQNSFIS